MIVRRRLAAGLIAAALLAAAGGLAWRLGRSVVVPVAVAAPGFIVARVVGPGTVQARVPVTISARVAAAITQVQVDVGDAVHLGQLLVTLDDRDLGARRGVVAGQQEALQRNTEGARATLAKATAELELARSRQQRDAELLAQGFVSQSAIDGSNASLRGRRRASTRPRRRLPPCRPKRARCRKRRSTRTPCCRTRGSSRRSTVSWCSASAKAAIRWCRARRS